MLVLKKRVEFELTKSARPFATVPIWDSKDIRSDDWT